jgi:hypothetical protein
MTAPIDFENIPNFDELRDKLVKAGLPQREAIGIAGTYVLTVAGFRQRVFAYSKDLAPTAPQCQSVFDPRFQHQPWTDGEDVVQAGETPGGDMGFNRRFSNIELDLKDLARGLKDIYACLATLRSEVSTLLGELRTEINWINGDIHRMGQGGVVLEPVPTKFPPLTGIKYLGTGLVLGKDVQIWDTVQGPVMIPLLTSVAAVEVDNRVKRVSLLGSLIQANTELKRKLDAAPLTKEELIQSHGDVITAGVPLRDLVAILPAGQQITNSANLVELVAEREALALRTGPGTEFALANAFGADEKIDTVSTVAVEKFTSVPVDARAALKAAGIDTMGKLAAAEDRALAAALKKAGVPATASESAGWRAAAKTLVSLR